MKTSVEISYYPLNEGYKEPIRKFINSLKENQNITVKSNSLSTHVFGNYDEVMSTITKCIKDAFELPHSIFVLKVLNMDRDK
ncbi:MAG TPA: hypothetical protein VKX35_06390 [Fermentimonas sp.]|nr:hypothetical protein [Fermentimonas sp.]